MAAVIVGNARMFVSRQLDAFAITGKNATAMLMLREYEEAHGDWLWQVGDQGRLVHLTDRMARMLDRDSDDLIGRHFVTLIAGGADERSEARRVGKKWVSTV